MNIVRLMGIVRNPYEPYNTPRNTAEWRFDQLDNQSLFS